jgi:protein-L-isoaspartate(D-aspartate) O-methyltransferase
MTDINAMDQMLAQQVRTAEVLDERVLDAMRRVPREQFVPAAWRSLAFAECALPLGHGKHMLTPMMVGKILQTLQLNGRERVLEIGTGSGYLSACMSALGAAVRSLELHASLAESARHNLQRANVRGAEVVQGDGMLLDEPLQYDCVVLTASLPTWQPRFERALKVGGRMFAVTGAIAPMEARLVQRLDTERFDSRAVFETALEPLENAPYPAPFRF